jgi:hypothetical protein
VGLSGENLSKTHQEAQISMIFSKCTATRPGRKKTAEGLLGKSFASDIASDKASDKAGYYASDIASVIAGDNFLTYDFFKQIISVLDILLEQGRGRSFPPPLLTVNRRTQMQGYLEKLVRSVIL